MVAQYRELMVLMGIAMLVLITIEILMVGATLVKDQEQLSVLLVVEAILILVMEIKLIDY